HQVRDTALPRGRAAAIVPPPASRAASCHAAPSQGRAARERLLLLSGRGTGCSLLLSRRATRCSLLLSRSATRCLPLLSSCGSGNGQRSPVTRERRRASRAVAVAVSAAA